MTVSSTTNRKSYAGNGSTTSFATSPMTFFDTSDLVVYVVDDVTGDETLLVENTDYTASGGDGSTGTLNLAAGSSPYGAPASDTTLVIVRILPVTQEVDLVNNDINDAEVMEGALDKLTMLIQQQLDTADRSVRLAASDPSDGDDMILPNEVGRASRVLGFDSAGAVTTYDASSSVTTSDNVTYTPGGTGAVATTVQAQLRQVISVKDFGAVGDGVTDDTAAFTAWTTYINSLGGAIAVIPPGTYNVTVPKAGIVCSFSNLKGFDLICGGAVIADQQTYTGTDTGTLFRFSACKNFRVSRPKITAEVVGNDMRGTYAFYLLQGCEGYHFDYEQEGGLAGLLMNRAYNDPASYRSRNYTVKAKCTNVHYPVTGQFSGDDGVIQLDSTGGYRDFFFYGVSHVDLRARIKNPNGTSLIKAYNGFGCDDFKLRYYDRDSDAHIDLPRVQLVWGDETAATHRDIDLHFDIANVAGSFGGPFFTFDKQDNSTAGDTTGRGHRLEGFTLSGASSQITGCNHIGLSGTGGVFASSGTPDVVKGMRVKDMVLTGASVSDDWSFITPVLSDIFLFDHVNCDNVLVCDNTSHGRVVFKDCTATAFTANRQGGQIPYGDNGGAKVLLDVKTASNSATLDFTTGISADFDEYEIVLSDIVPETDATDLYFNVAQSGTFTSGASEYRHSRFLFNDGAASSLGGSAADTKIIVAVALGNSTGENLSGVIRSLAASGTTHYKQFAFDMAYLSSTPNTIRLNGAGTFVKNTTAINGFRLAMSSGNITSGSAALYGIRKV